MNPNPLARYPIAALSAVLLLFAGCDAKDAPAKTDEKPAAKSVAKADAKPEPKAEPKAEAKAEPPPPAAPIDTATFVAVDLSSVAAIAMYTVDGPPGATITPDKVGFGETEPGGAVIAKDGFSMHVWNGSLGGERSALPVQAQMLESKYAETKMDFDKGTLDYTMTKAGVATHGYIQQKFATMKGAALCGTSGTHADDAALEPYRKACATLAKKKAAK